MSEMLDQSTSLNLLARDGILHIRFPVVLSAEQYAELLETAKQASTADALTHELSKLGEKWNMRIAVRKLNHVNQSGSTIP